MYVAFSVGWPSMANLVLLRAAMLMPQRASSMVTIAVWRSGQLLTFLAMSQIADIPCSDAQAMDVFRFVSSFTTAYEWPR